jgi:hypothetical protein
MLFSPGDDQIVGLAFMAYPELLKASADYPAVQKLADAVGLIRSDHASGGKRLRDDVRTIDALAARLAIEKAREVGNNHG